MNKFITLFFLLIYTTASGGVPVFLQQCKEQVVDVRVGLNHEDDCGKECPTEKTGKKCCKITQQKLQSTKSNGLSESGVLKSIPQGLLPEDTVQIILFPNFSTYLEHTQSNGPPLAGKIALYIQYCSFII